MTSIYMGTEMDEDGDYVDVYRLSRRKLTARKQHRCNRCRRPILVGEQYWRDFSMAGKEPYMEKWHADTRLCFELACRNTGHHGPAHDLCVITQMGRPR